MEEKLEYNKAKIVLLPPRTQTTHTGRRLCFYWHLSVSSVRVRLNFQERPEMDQRAADCILGMVRITICGSRKFIYVVIL